MATAYIQESHYLIRFNQSNLLKAIIFLCTYAANEKHIRRFEPSQYGAYYSAERNGTPDSAKYLFCGTHRNGPKTASQLSGYYIEMYPKQVALIS